MKFPNTAFLLDSAPRTWSSQEDRHLAICQSLIEAGSRPVLIFSGPLPADMHQRFMNAGVPVETANYERGVWQFYKALKKIFQEYEIKRVHAIFFDYFRAVGWITRLAGAKSVVYEMQNGGVFRATSWKRQIIRLRNRIMTAPFVRIIAISEYIKGQLIEGGVPGQKIVVRHLGIDTTRFRPNKQQREQLAKQFGVEAGEMILSTVSYLRPIKNPQLIVQACGELAKRGTRAHLFVAGDGEMLEELQQLSAELGISDRAHWLGLVPDPTSLLQASDAFLLATVGEAFGLVLAESMACGVPVVGARAGAISEVVAHGETGVLVDPWSAHALANGIETLAMDPALHSRMAKQAIDRVANHFSLTKAVDETLAIHYAL
ncbi:MAG TPA: glycosyltransferase family 4 protein [Pyrinomonadaceae bacterium]|nr:glycosyltransferase family 4 protein [Pyrinomonadaceae bacterium]